MQQGPLHITLFRIPVILFVLSIVLLEFPAATALMRSPYSGIEPQNLVVQRVDPSGPNAGANVRRGDEILAVDGERVRNYNHLRYIVQRNATFGPQNYTLRRAGEEITVPIEYTAIPPSHLYRRFAFLIVGFTFLLTGLLVYLRRTDAVGLLFALNCTIFAFFLTDRPIYSLPVFQLTAELFNDAVILFFPAVFLHFFLVFPERPAGYRVSRRRKIVLYGIPSAMFATTVLLALRQFVGVSSDQAPVSTVLAVATVYLFAYVIISLVVFARSYRKSSVGQKQKLRVAIAGTIAGILPFLLMTVWRQISPGASVALESVSVAALAFISVSFAYAILKLGAIELNIVVRKSLAYAFLTGAVIAAYYALVNVLGDYLNEEFRLRPVYFSMISVLVLAVIFAPAREVVQRAVDRVFSRGDYDFNHEVVEFNRQLSKRLMRREVLADVTERVNRLFEPRFVGFCFEGGGGDTWGMEAMESGSNGPPPDFPRRSMLGRYLSRYRKPLMVEYLDHSWGRRNLDRTSFDFLGSSGAAVCVPLIMHDALAGLIVLGPKRSGLLYSRTDSALLERFADHMGLVLENADLHEATIEKERLKSEVLLAREIQLGLLPKKFPEHPALQIQGRMMSCEEVGGDYFDHFTLDRHRIGVAIGDVSGHGIPAAMLMSSLQAVFKNLAIRERMNPGELVGELNRYLCDNGKTGQLATFFYGIFDLENTTFAYANAGHCPSLLIKESYVDRLGVGGLLLGVQPNIAYKEGRVRIEPGDLLCLYTDGISEQSNGSDVQFGEHRLVDFLTAHKNQPLQSLQEGLFATVLEFGNGRQDDDITTIIARHNGA